MRTGVWRQKWESYLEIFFSAKEEEYQKKLGFLGEEDYKHLWSSIPRIELYHKQRCKLILTDAISWWQVRNLHHLHNLKVRSLREKTPALLLVDSASSFLSHPFAENRTWSIWESARSLAIFCMEFWNCHRTNAHTESKNLKKLQPSLALKTNSDQQKKGKDSWQIKTTIYLILSSSSSSLFSTTVYTTTKW